MVGDSQIVTDLVTGMACEDPFECKEAIHAIQSTFPGCGCGSLEDWFNLCDQIYSQLFYSVAFLFTDFVSLISTLKAVS